MVLKGQVVLVDVSECNGHVGRKAYRRIISADTASIQVMSREYCPRTPFTEVVGTSLTRIFA
jgi:hypothetical protein